MCTRLAQLVERQTFNAFYMQIISGGPGFESLIG